MSVTGWGWLIPGNMNNYKPEQLPVFTDTGVWMRLIAGNAYGLRNDVKTHSPLFYLHVVLQPGARFGLPKEHAERGFYIAKGSVEVAGIIYVKGQMLVFTKGADPLILAKEHTTLMLLGGEPITDHIMGKVFPPILISNSSGNPNFPAIHIPI